MAPRRKQKTASAPAKKNIQMSGSDDTAIVDRVPPEILKQIFIWNYELSDNLLEGRVSSSEAPLLLTQVSKYWKEVAFSTKEIWCSMSFTLRHPRTKEEDAFDVKMTRQWIKRADPKCIRFTLECQETQGVPDQTLASLPSLLNNIPHLTVNSAINTLQDLTCLRDRLSKLRSLTFSTNDANETLRSQTLNTFGRLPALRTLHLPPWFFKSCAVEQLQVRWHQLTDCTLPVTAESLSVICSNLTYIKKLSLILTSPAWQVATNRARKPSEFIDLEVLHITALDDLEEMWTDSTLSNVMSHFELPKLEELSVVLPPLDEIFIDGLKFGRVCGAALYSLLARASRTVKIMRLCNLHISGEALIPCFEPLTDIVDLDLEDNPERKMQSGGNIHIDSLLLRMTRDPGQTSYLMPNLRVLALKGLIFDDLLLDNMIQSRFQSTDKETTLRVASPRETMLQILSSGLPKVIVEGGLKLTVIR